ncbi:MAG TPA: SDR family oxidoreductase [Acidobacteriaceae bacterium]
MASTILRKAWQGKWALVTGASAGIGEAIAVELAAAGANLILTARRQGRLDALASRLRGDHSIETQVIVADLEQAEAPQQIFDATEGAGLAVDLLANNAGFGGYGEFLRSDLERELGMVQVNCTAVVHLTRLFLPKMVERRHGSVMIVSSMAAYQPVPYMATYAATKAFDRLLAEALDEEVKRYGVRVSALCPGTTKSEFGQVAGSRPRENRHFQSAQEVALRGLEGLAQGRPWVVPHSMGRLQIFALRFVPRSMVSWAAERMFRPAGVQ